MRPTLAKIWGPDYIKATQFHQNKICDSYNVKCLLCKIDKNELEATFAKAENDTKPL